MTYAFFYGLGTGILLSSMLGTVFFSLVQNSIDNGVKSSLFICTGVIVSDVVLIALTYFNADLVPKGSTTEMVVRLLGAAVLLAMGVGSFFKKTAMRFPHNRPGGMAILIGQGFMLNFFNPGNFISWLAISSMLVNVLHFTIGQRVWFYVGALLAIFVMELLISKGAVYLKRFISRRFLQRLNLVLGVVFIAFSLWLLWPLAKPWLPG
jgi:L-lysine exporter family protein LysE/ArgO